MFIIKANRKQFLRPIVSQVSIPVKPPLMI